MPPIRGRPRILNEEMIKNVVLSHKEEIVYQNKIISKQNEVWISLSKELKQISSHALYTLVVNNRFNIKNLLLKNIPTAPMCEETIEDADCLLNASIASLTETTLSEETEGNKLDIVFDRNEFDNLIEKRQYGRTEKKKATVGFRQYLVLQAGEWQNAITTKLWSEHKVHCGYQFKRSKIFNNKLTISGKCDCGSIINGIADDIMTGETVTINCTRSKGSGTCGKRYLRNPFRLQLGRDIYEGRTTAMKHRIETAKDLMEPGDPEPPHLYKSQALYDAVKEYTDTQVLNKNPIISLAIAKRTTYQNIIHNVGLDSFFTIYWLKYQLDVYKQYASLHYASIAIDATGSIVKKIIHPDKSKSQHIFLYTCVVNSPDKVKYPVTQMISESHTTLWILLWLMQWTQSGAPPPREVTCDQSVALLTAVVRAFTGCVSIDKYADEIWEDKILPSCYIRIDVAHFIKKYAKFLKIVRPKIKTFYLASISKLIITRSIEEAENILFSIFIIALNDTEGKSLDGRDTSCEIHKEKLKYFLTNEIFDITDNVEITDTEDTDHEFENNDTMIQKIDTQFTNRWKKWAKDIYTRASSNLNDGDRQNAHYLPQLATKLLEDMTWFPLWSAVYRDKFGYGRVPASSAAVEAEFSIIKSQLLKNIKLPMRADLFVFRHIEFLKGRLNLVGATVTSSNVKPKTIDISSEIVENTICDSNNVTMSIVHTNKSQIEECPACANNDIPSGAHKCYKCGKNVHAFPPCSNAINGEEEGYGEKRICRSCENLSPENVKTTTCTRNKIDTSIISNSESQIVNCFACSNNHYPSGPYKCYICEKNVHLFSACSKPIEGEVEGYEKRICIACHRLSITNTQEMANLNEIENWRGLAKSTSKSRYLRGTFKDKEFILHEKLSKVPILSNGNSLYLKPINIKGRKITLANTCAFDSIFQLFLSAVYDSKAFSTICDKLAKQNLFFQMIRNTSVKGISKQTYSLRATLLQEIFPIETGPHNCAFINCEVTAAYLCAKLFSTTPSLQETSSCDHGCQSRIKHFPTLQIQHSFLLYKEFSEIIEKQFLLGGISPCCQENCIGSEITTPPQAGKTLDLFFFFYILSLYVYISF